VKPFKTCNATKTLGKSVQHIIEPPEQVILIPCMVISYTDVHITPHGGYMGEARLSGYMYIIRYIDMLIT
jgi:hypothetical protein